MNLFIFRVDTGTMIEFELNMATESVTQLKSELWRLLSVPPEAQVLLINGGMTLENNSKVIKYSAGTESNPIFLFDKTSLDPKTPAPRATPSPHAYQVKAKFAKCQAADCAATTSNLNPEYSDEEEGEPLPVEGYSSYNEFWKRVFNYKRLPATMETVTKRATLAKELCEEATREYNCCTSLVLDQHLQHQGWQVAIANLEDIIADFKRRKDILLNQIKGFLADRDGYIELLNTFKDVLEKLKTVPILPSLLLTRDEGESSSQGDEASSVSKSTSLIDWIEAGSDSSDKTVDFLYETSSRGVNIYNEDYFNNLSMEMDITMESVVAGINRGITGLSDRLTSLNELVEKTKNIAKEQTHLGQSFASNEMRACDLRDTSVLPDLCHSHKQLLDCMLKKHFELCESHFKCMRSKEELCKTLNGKLIWLKEIEIDIKAIMDKAVSTCNWLTSLRRNLNLLEQVHMAPEVYCATLVEVVRRKKFSQAFLLWASELACYMLTIYNDEVTRRREFKSKYYGHFLLSLFPGMNDLPSSFATQAPSVFDSSLPNISVEDIEEIKLAMPESAELLAIPDMSSVTNFFMSKSMAKNDDNDDKIEETCVEEKLVAVVTEMGLASNLDQNLLKPASENDNYLLPQGITQLKDLDKGCESETDTEEFEKVQCQSPMELQFDKDVPCPRPGYSDVTTITEDNLQSSRSEQDKLKDLLLNLSTLCRTIFVNLRQQLEDIKTQVLTDNSALEIHCRSLGSSWETLTNEFDSKERELHQLTESHHSEISVYKQQLKEVNDELKNLREENSCLESSLNKVFNENKELQDMLNSANATYAESLSKMEAQIKDLQAEKDRLVREHKLEMDNLRNTFRRMTDRSLSECADKSSIESSSPDAKRKEIEMLKAMEELKASENARLDKAIQERNKEFEFQLKGIREDAKRLNDSKDRYIQHIRQRGASLTLEVTKYKNILQQMAQADSDNSASDLRKQVADLQKVKLDLEQQLHDERMQRMEASEMTSSTSSLVAAKRCKPNDSMPTSISVARVSKDTCSKGDIVLVTWKEDYKHYMIEQESKTLHFVHSDSMETVRSMGISASDTAPIYFIAKVEEKEFCLTKKSENRYNIPKGTKFYRVKISVPTSPDVSRTMSQSQTTPRACSSSAMDDSISDSACHSLPNSPTKTEK